MFTLIQRVSCFERQMDTRMEKFIARRCFKMFCVIFIYTLAHEVSFCRVVYNLRVRIFFKIINIRYIFYFKTLHPHYFIINFIYKHINII